MAPLELEGDTLGKKHRHYNKLVEEALKSNQPLEPIELSPYDDIQNLLKIDVACKNRNVDYILEVFKSEDQLYVSKAIKRSRWLLTEPQYAHIINPEYLYTKLYPQMTPKAFNKLMLNIRLHLKDEKRVEAFYNYIKEIDIKLAHKWLQNCPIPLVEREVVNSKDDIRMDILIRLFKKSFFVYETYIRTTIYFYYDMTRKTEFMVKKYPEKILDLLESLKDGFHYRFNERGTKYLMEKCPDKIVSKFQVFGKCLHLATFAKLLKRNEDIEEFLLKHAENKELEWLYAFDKVQHFITHMPKESRFEFVKKVFIDKETLNNAEEDHKYQTITYRAVDQLSKNRSQNANNIYMWYKFAPFDTAYTDLVKLIRAETLPLLRNSMLQVLLSCASHNKQHIQTLLKYYHDNHINEPFKFKIQFVNSFISNVDTHNLDDQSWELLSHLFHSMEVFIESGNNVQFCIKAIIVRSAIKNEQVPDIILNKFVFDTLKTIQTKLKKQEEKDSVFKYLQDYIITKSNPLNLKIESEFNEAVTLCEHLFNLIKDWGKELRECTYALDRVKEIINVKKEKHWSRNLTTLYNTKKSWRKAMFEESIVILPHEKVCVNALKHDPVLLFRNEEQVQTICCNDNISFRNFFKKIRIYWPHTLAEDWRTFYLKRLCQPYDHKAVIVGLCTLLSREQINDLLTKYAPSERKIDWNEMDQLELSQRKQIAKNIHKARPPPSVEGILLYAKGDYLQYAVPSMNSILSQLSPNKSRFYIPILLNAPVSLQKFGLRCIIRKLPSEESKPMLSDIWNSTKNSSIRTVLFTQIFQLLCKENNTYQLKDTWDLLSMFIDKLGPDDNRFLYKKLGEVYKVPTSIKPQFFMKSYAVLSSLPAKYKAERIFRNVEYMVHDLIEFFNDDFVINVLLKDVKNLFAKGRDINYESERLVSSFILASKNEETQVRRYEKSLDIILEHYLPQWEMIFETKYYIKERIKSILEKLVSNMETYTYEMKFQIPVKTFEKILLKLENKLSYQKDYVLLTTWKLVIIYVKILNENKHVVSGSEQKADKKMSAEEKTKIYNAIHERIAPPFAKICVEYLNEDLSRFGTSIYSLFAAAVKSFFRNYLAYVCEGNHRLLYLKCLLQSGNEIELYLMVHDVFVRETQNYCYCNPKRRTYLKKYMT